MLTTSKPILTPTYMITSSEEIEASDREMDAAAILTVTKIANDLNAQESAAIEEREGEKVVPIVRVSPSAGIFGYS
jgi:hypothetical protein